MEKSIQLAVEELNVIDDMSDDIKEEVAVVVTENESDVKEEVRFVRKTQIEKSNVNRTIKNLFKNKNKLRFDKAIQRNEVWTLDQKSDLIHSILYGYPIPPVLVQESDDGYTWFLDGKQRLTTILSFLNGEWALSKKTEEVFGYKIAGMKFADLNEDMRDLIYDETITLIKMKNMTDEEIDKMFVKWNSGTPLSKIELTRAMHSKLIEQINHISNLEFFQDHTALTEKAKNRFIDQEVILQIAMLLDKGKNGIKGFGSNQIKDYVMEMKNDDRVLSDELIKTFEKASNYLSMAVSDYTVNQQKKIMKKINIPMIFYTSISAEEKNVNPSLFGEFIKIFLLETYNKDSDYGKACQAGSSKKESVLIRLNEMNLAFDDFVKKVNKSKNADNAVERFKKEQEKEIKKQVKENNVIEEEVTTV